MGSSVLSEMCLICSNFDCEVQSFHKKQTFLSVQSLLLKNTLLYASIQKKYDSHQYQRSQISVQNIIRQSSHKESRSSLNKVSLIHRFSTLTFSIQTIFQKLQSHNFFKAKQLESLVLASLSTLELMLNIKTNSLLYHDVVQILKFILRLKFTNEESFFDKMSLPFTKNRIQRTIRQLNQKIQSKENQLKNLESINCFQSSNRHKVFQDLTNRNFKHDSICKKNPKQNYTNQKNFEFKDEKLILTSIMDQTSFFKKVTEMFQNLSSDCFLTDSQRLLQILQGFFSKIQDVEQNFIDRLNNSQINQIKQFPCDLKEGESEKQNCISQRTSLNPEKSVYPIIKSREKIKNQVDQQVAEYIEFAYIEGIPFPTNRKSIDFSMLQLTDDLLINYLPALQKFKDLEEICIRKNKLTQMSYRLLKNSFPTLRSIDLRQNIITEEIVQILICFKYLNILYLSDCQINPVLLIKICLNLEGINVLYCDRLIFTDSETQSNNKKIKIIENSDFRSIFYIMCLNFKKLMYFSIKGYFSEDIYKFERNSMNCLQKKREEFQDDNLKQINLFFKIYEILRRRHGILEI